MTARRDAGVPRQWRRSLSVRLAVAYAALFLASTAALFALAYVLLGQSLRERDRAALRDAAAELAADVALGGRRAIEAEAAEIEVAPASTPILLRIAEVGQPTRLVPASRWASYDTRGMDAASTSIPSRGDGPPLDALAVPTRGASFVLQVAAPSAARAEVLERFRELFGLIALPVLLIALGGGALLARRALAPVRSLADTARRVALTGRLGERVPTTGSGDELDELAGLVNGMLVRVEALVDGMRGTLDDAAHDLRTPLTRLRAGAERALFAGPEEQREALSDAVEETDAVLAILAAVMDVAEAEAGTLALRRAPHDLAHLVAQVVDLYEIVAEEKGIALVLVPAEALVAPVDAPRVRQAVANLVDNALKYTPAGGAVRVSVEQDGGAAAVVAVEDDGPGVPAADRPRIWDRLFRGDASRSERGLGLGLSVVRAVAEAHGGAAALEDGSAGGSRFTLRLPTGSAGRSCPPSSRVTTPAP